MEQDGMEYADALALAQKLGYAEADPTADVEGFDALAKIVILSNVLLGGNDPAPPTSQGPASAASPRPTSWPPRPQASATSSSPGP